jgi:DNA-binding Xre family transcriptional regulator
MKLKIDKARLDALMARRGVVSYKGLSELAASEGIRLAFSTIYQAVDEETDTAWRSTTLEALCQVLRCKPSDLIPELGGVSAHTHDAPRPTEEPEGVAA